MNRNSLLEFIRPLYDSELWLLVGAGSESPTNKVGVLSLNRDLVLLMAGLSSSYLRLLLLLGWEAADLVLVVGLIIILTCYTDSPRSSVQKKETEPIALPAAGQLLYVVSATPKIDELFPVIWQAGFYVTGINEGKCCTWFLSLRVEENTHALSQEAPFTWPYIHSQPDREGKGPYRTDP